MIFAAGSSVPPCLCCEWSIMSMAEFQLARPRSIAQAAALLAQHGSGAQIIAGGTDLVPSMRQRLFEPKLAIDIRGIGEMRGIREIGDGSVEIGASTTIHDI